jgi:hypothetical protein
MLARLFAHRSRTLLLAALVCAILAGTLVVAAVAQGKNRTKEPFTTTFHLERCSWAATGQNLYFSLDPGTRHVLEGEDEGEAVQVVVSVLDETQQVAGVTTRVIEEREFIDGELAEVSRNFFALCRENGGIFYFGEEVDFYENGAIAGHEGAWLAGVDGAQAGLIMPALPLLGARYVQEIAPDVALDRAEVTSLSARADVPFGTFDGCLETVETTPLEPKAEDIKIYCPDIGIVIDGPLQLVEHSAGPRGR